MAGFVDKLKELAEKVLDTLIKSAIGDITAKDPVATIRNEKRQQPEPKPRRVRNPEPETEVVEPSIKPHNRKDDEKPKAQRNAPEPTRRVDSPQVELVVYPETPQKKRGQIDLSPIHTAMNAEALSGNQFYEFWDSHVNAEKMHGNPAEYQARFDRLKNELAKPNQDNQEIRETLSAIKKFLDTPLEDIRRDIRGIKGMSPIDKDNAFREVNEIPQVKAIRQILGAIDAILNPKAAATETQAMPEAAIAPATAAAEVQLPDVRTEALIQQKSVDLSTITEALQRMKEWSDNLETKQIKRKGGEKVELSAFGQIWLNIMGEETWETARKAADYQRKFNENRANLEAAVTKNLPNVGQSLTAMDRFLESFLKDCIDAKESSFAGNRVKAREGLLSREDMKPFGQLLQSCKECLTQISKSTAR